MSSGPHAPRGSTRVVGIIGDPVTHSRSPAIHNAAFAARGLDWVYVAFPVPAGRGADAIAAMRVLGIAGLNVTMPHKSDVVAACDELTDVAAALGSVNAVVHRDGRVLGDSTDGAGLVASLRDHGVELAGRRVLVLGAGGAARAIVRALGDAGSAVTVAARRAEAGDRAAALAPGGVAVAFSDLDARVRATDVVVNATPIGMGGEPPPFDPGVLTAEQFLYDTVYHPSPTPLLAAATALGVPCAGGLGMLVHQAALAFTLWTGEPAPLDVMTEASAGVGDAPDSGPMTAALVVASTVVGLVVGVLLPVVIDRVPEKVPVLAGPYPEPARSLRTPTGWFVALLTAAGFGATAARFGTSAVLPAYLVLVAALVALSVIDLRWFLLPNRIVFPLTAVSLVLLGLGAVGEGEAGAYGRALVAAAVAFVAFAGLHLVSPRSMGFGDVKLSFVLGLYLGYLGWGEVVLGLFLGFLYGALIGVGLIVTGLRSRKDHVPFGPFLAAGTITAILVGQAVLDWWST